MTASFDPDAHSALVEMGGRLRELAGDTAYAAGRDYLRKGLVKQGLVAGTTAYATVSGSTDYRVSIAFTDEVKVACTCPAHRRSRFCKHVVAAACALLERPAEFAIAEAAPEPTGTPPERRRRSARQSERKPNQAELRAAGLATFDRMLEELADGGLMTLGPDKAALLAGAGELVRALKLRRLGNLTLALQRAASDRRGGELDATSFATLLTDLSLTRQATAAALAEASALDPRLAEDLIGRTWREDDLETTGGLELLEVGYTQVDDGEFRVDTSYLVDLASGTLYAEKQITPSRLHAPPKPRHRQRLVLEKGGLYPGLAPRRLKLSRFHREPLLRGDVDRLLGHVPDILPPLGQALALRLAVPFGLPEVVAGFRPSALVVQQGMAGALDREGRFLSLIWPDNWWDELPNLLPEPGGYAVFGLLSQQGQRLEMRCLSVVSGALAWPRGPVFPDIR